VQALIPLIGADRKSLDRRPLMIQQRRLFIQREPRNKIGHPGVERRFGIQVRRRGFGTSRQHENREREKRHDAKSSDARIHDSIAVGNGRNGDVR
jgi:hypothetical protein